MCFNVVRKGLIGLKVEGSMLLTAETDADDTAKFAGPAPRRFSLEAGFESISFATFCPDPAWFPIPSLGFYQVNGCRYFSVKASL